MESVRKKQKTWLYLLMAALVTVIWALLGTLGMVDYYGAGILTVFIFYFSGDGNGGACWDSSLRFTGSMWRCWVV